MLLLATLFLAAATAYASTPDRASNFPVTPELAAKYGCGETCQASLKVANDQDLTIFDTPFDFDFYATAKNFSDSKPGDVLKVKPVDPNIMAVPYGMSTFKIQYVSTDLDNSTIPATGFIAFPYIRQRDPFKLVAFAHGTSGVFRGCAPSTSSFLFNYDSWSPLLFAGYAIVATDYAGLGNNYKRHKYISSRANANDVYWSAIAAQKAFPHYFTREWVSIGHSQGGGSSWKLSEHELVQADESGYLGGVAIGPATYIYDSFADLLSLFMGATEEELKEYGVVGVFPSLYFALRAVFPNYTAPFFSHLLRTRLELGEAAQFCDLSLAALVSDLNATEIFENIDDNALAPFKEFQELNAPAQGVKTTRPLLVIQGAIDSIVFEDVTASAYNNSCKAGNQIRFSVYPDLDHSAVVGASAPEWLEFFENLFHGGALSGCSMPTIVPFDAEYARRPLDSEIVLFRGYN